MLVTRGAAEVSVLVPRSELPRAVSAILDAGVFHPKQVPGAEEGAEKSRLQRLMSEADNLAMRMRAYLESVGAPTEPAEADMGEVHDWVEVGERVVREAEMLDAKLDPVLKRLVELRTPGTEFREAAEVAKAYSWLDFNLEELKKMKHLKVALLRPPKEHLPRWEELARQEPVLVAIVEDYEPLRALVIVLYPAEFEELIEHLAGETDAKPVVLPSEAPQNLRKAAEYFEGLEKRLEEELRRNVPKIRELLAKLLTVREAMRLLLATAFTKFFAIMTGYVPHSDIPRFTDKVLKATRGTAVITQKGYVRVEEEETPSVIKVPKPLAPFKALLESYGLPKPKQISPIIVMAITFPLIFGMAFPDLGHGLVLLLFGLWLMKKGEFGSFARGEGVRQLGLLLVYLGISSMIFGFLAAEFFGPWPLGELLVHMWCSLGFAKPPYATPLYVAHVTHVIETEGAKGLVNMCLALAKEVAATLGLATPQQLQHISAEQLAELLSSVPKEKLLTAVLGTSKLNMMAITVYFSIYVALLLGTFLLVLSSIFGFYNYLVEGEKWEAIASGLSKILVFGGVFIAFLAGLPFLYNPSIAIRVAAYTLDMVAGQLVHIDWGSEIAQMIRSTVMATWPIVAAMIYGGLFLAFFGKIAEVVARGGGIGAALANAALEIFDLILIAVGNTISFLRIFALALAHSGLMYGFYIMALMAGVAGGAIVYLLGNLLVIGLESIVAFAHTLRLHYYEMFSKFMITVGKPFQPVRAYARLATA